jgi:hypothetical protein
LVHRKHNPATPNLLLFPSGIFNLKAEDCIPVQEPSQALEERNLALGRVTERLLLQEFEEVPDKILVWVLVHLRMDRERAHQEEERHRIDKAYSPVVKDQGRNPEDQAPSLHHPMANGDMKHNSLLLRRFLKTVQSITTS